MPVFRPYVFPWMEYYTFPRQELTFLIIWRENEKDIFLFYNSYYCSNHKLLSKSNKDTSSTTAQMYQALDHPNRTDDEINPDIKIIIISSSYLMNNSSINNSTVDDSKIRIILLSIILLLKIASLFPFQARTLNMNLNFGFKALTANYLLDKLAECYSYFPTGIC